MGTQNNIGKRKESLLAFQDKQKLNFLQENLPDIYAECEKVKKQLHGEND